MKHAHSDWHSNEAFQYNTINTWIYFIFLDIKGKRNFQTSFTIYKYLPTRKKTLTNLKFRGKNTISFKSAPNFSSKRKVRELKMGADLNEIGKRKLPSKFNKSSTIQ